MAGRRQVEAKGNCRDVSQDRAAEISEHKETRLTGRK